MQSTLEALKPEAAYFLTDGGERAGLIIFDLKGPADTPSIAEPGLTGVNASLDFIPVMNAGDLKAGLEKAAKEMPSR